MRLPIRAALSSAGRYALRNPMSVLRVARHAISMRIAVPLDALRWFVANAPASRKAPTDVEIAADPPAIRVGATIDLMGSKLRASTAVSVVELRVDADSALVTLQLRDTNLEMQDESKTPISGLIRSGALDLSKPGNLVKFMPKRPPALVEARDDVIVVDLLRVPKLAANATLRRVLERVTPVMRVDAINTEGDFLLLALRPTPSGVVRALNPGV